MKKILVLVFALFSIMQTYASDNMVMCTMDAMQCSDGSWVGRTGPNCQFVCPGEQKACTMDYTPVCGEVQIQCIQAPCYPVKQTFSNKCELENNSLAKFLYSGECKPDGQTTICDEKYNPVCGNDGKNYENACLAWKVGVKYNNMCLPTKIETQVYSAWNLAISKYVSKITDENKKATILEKVISRVNFIFGNYKAFSLNQNILGYIKDLALNSLQKDIYEKYLKENISNISKVNPVLGGKWNITDIKWTGNNIATINYEDGHIAEIIEVEIKVENGKIVTHILN